MQRDLIVIAHNLRSAHNVGSLLRTADGLGVSKVYFTGYTPYPKKPNDSRMPHISEKLNKQIEKTSLGSEKTVNWVNEETIEPTITKLKRSGYSVIALEQAPDSISLEKYEPTPKMAIIVGREVEGLEPDILKLTDLKLSIPMLGAKESFNVVQAAAMTLYRLRYF